MQSPDLSVREMEADDIERICSYWLSAEPAYLEAMGVDMNKMIGREELVTMLTEQLLQPYEQKKSYCIIWQVDGRSVGHCNVNKIVFGETAYMHLHIWYTAERKLGLGPALIKMTLPYFFTNLQLKKICCEPYALNLSPNKALVKAGFEFISEYITTPGIINFEQPVMHWEISRQKAITQ